jgi:sulfate/thiosulfate-binding protein
MVKTFCARRVFRISLAAMALAVAVAPFQGCNKAASGNGVTLILGGYSTPREAYREEIIPAFKKFWKEKTGQDVEFQESYQGSGAQSRAIVSGFEADIAALSQEEDVSAIQEAGLITHDWKKSGPRRGIATSSIVVIAVRPGNPKNIHDWSDLAREGLNVLTPDPSTSGGARWNINAIYGAALRGYAGVAKDDPAAAGQFLRAVFKNVSIMDKGARESITTYEKGVGDAAITYENEVLVGRRSGESYDYVVPHSTILIENPVALVDSYVDRHGVRPVAEAFVQFLWSNAAQRGFAKYGLRPVDPEVASQVPAEFPPVEDLWTVEFLGGWTKVEADLYGQAGAYTKLIQELRDTR